MLEPLIERLLQLDQANPKPLYSQEYPGKDYIVGLCEEAINLSLKGRQKENRELMGVVLEVFNNLLNLRRKHLTNPPESTFEFDVVECILLK